MDPDGALSIDANYFLNTQRYDLGFQALPWLNVRFEYSGLDHFNTYFPVYWDRSFAAKIRLWNETESLPAVSIGATDLVGTGLFSGEYLVASKQFGNFDTTIGLGWGSMGSTNLFRNPFTLISRSFENRPVSLTPGGTDFGVFFHGPVGLFGGVIWHTPIDGLSLTAEYSSDAYKLQSTQGNFTPLSQVNYAISYELNETTAFSFSWLYGRSFGGEISFALDPTTDHFTQRIGPPLPPPPPVRTPQQQQEALNAMLSRRRPGASGNANKAMEVMVDALWQSNLSIADITVQGRVLSLAVANGSLKSNCQNIAQLVGRYSLTFKTIIVTEGGTRTSCPVANTPALALAAEYQPTELGPASGILHPIEIMTINAIGETPDVPAAIALFRSDAGKQRLQIQAINVSEGQATIYYMNGRYFSEIDALDRLIRIAMADLPSEVEEFHLIATNGSVPLREFDILRAPAERSFGQTGTLNFANDVSSKFPAMQNPVLSSALAGIVRPQRSPGDSICRSAGGQRRTPSGFLARWRDRRKPLGQFQRQPSLQQCPSARTYRLSPVFHQRKERRRIPAGILSL